MAKQNTLESVSLGVNVDYIQNGSKAVFRVDLTQDFGPTGSGKNRRVASTMGNQSICGGRAKVGINVVDPVIARTLTAADFTDSEPISMGENLSYSITAGTLLLVVDMAADGRRSGANRDGKTRLIGTSNGLQGIQQGIRVSVNCYDPIPTGPALTVFE